MATSDEPMTNVVRWRLRAFAIAAGGGSECEHCYVINV